MDLARFEITPALRQSLEPLVLDALFEYTVRHRTKTGMANDATAQITVTQAMEVLAAQQSRWKTKLHTAVASLELAQDGLPRRIGSQLQELLLRAHEFFRREGAGTFRTACVTVQQNARFRLLWADLFSRRVLDWLREQELIANSESLDVADAMVECAKLWTQDVCRQVGPDNGGEVEPSTFFLDAESDITAVFERGPIKLKVRGRPEALLLRPVANGIELHDYKLGEPDQVELRIVQVLLYMALIERAKGQPCVRGTLGLFRCRSINAQAFPPEVDKAFTGFLGNAAAVRRLKIKASLARREPPLKLMENFLFTGAEGLGKTTLARRLAQALDTPLIEIAADSFKNVDDLITCIDQALASSPHKTKAKELRKEAGRPLLKYPPLALLFGHVHELRRRAESLLPLLDLQERRITTDSRIAWFPDITILATTSEPGKLAEPFLSRFRPIDLEPYRPDEVAAMLRPVFEERKLKLPDSLAGILARMGRCNPRRAIAMAREFRDYHEHSPIDVPLNRETLFKLARNDWQVDERGLTGKDYQYLQALESGPKGLPALQQLLPFSGSEVTMLIEPYLLLLGAIHRSPRGRVLTVLGEQLLHRRAA